MGEVCAFLASQKLKFHSNHMLHAAGLLFRCFWIDTRLRQQAGKEAVFLIGLLGYLTAHISQAEKEVLVYGEETALF